MPAAFSLDPIGFVARTTGPTQNVGMANLRWREQRDRVSVHSPAPSTSSCTLDRKTKGPNKTAATPFRTPGNSLHSWPIYQYSRIRAIAMLSLALDGAHRGASELSRREDTVLSGDEKGRKGVSEAIVSGDLG